MNKTLKNIANIALITLIISTGMALQAQVRPYRVSDRQIQTLLNRIENRTDAFKTQLARSLDNSTLDGTRREDSINAFVSDFENATNQLKDRFSARNSAAGDVQEVLDKAAFINRFMLNHTMSRASETQWTRIRTDLNTLAGYYRVAVNWNDKVVTPTYPGPYTATDAQMRTLLGRLQQRSIAFRDSYQRWSDRFDRPTNPSASYDISRDLTDFDRELNALSRSFSNNRNSNQVADVLKAALPINRFVGTNRTSREVTSDWALVRTDLDTLASYYRVSWNWNDTITPIDPYGRLDSRLTGTYRLNTGQSDNVRAIVDKAIINANYGSNRGDRMQQNLERRLRSPEYLAFEMNGQQINMSAANGEMLTLTADGVAQSETQNGRKITTTVTATDRDLTINYEGNRINDYYVNFMPERNGQLKVTRRVYLEGQNETVTVTSVYDKTSQLPQWNVAGGPSNSPGGLNINQFLVPNNTRIIATLDRPLSTKTAKDGDHFSMTVTSPSQYYGDVIEGNVIGEKSGVFSGRANLSLSFDSIRRGGKIYKFAGIVEEVRDADGDMINVNNEGQIRDSNQTTKTVTRAGLGAAIGAIIGAIAGGGSGAAIGAGVGAGAGAGTVILQGRDNLDLSTGSVFTITATAPANTR